MAVLGDAAEEYRRVKLCPIGTETPDADFSKTPYADCPSCGDPVPPKRLDERKTSALTALYFFQNRLDRLLACTNIVELAVFRAKKRRARESGNQLSRV